MQIALVPKFHLETPAGEAVQHPPALGTPRPALKFLTETLPQPFRHRLTSARELATRHRVSELPFPTAEPACDRLLNGGFGRRSLVELVGGRSSGRYSLLLTLLAAATSVGEVAAFVDLGDGLDPQSAAGSGIDLARLLWLRPEHLKAALAAAEIALHGGFPLVVVDLGLPPVRGGKGQEGAWQRLARAARERGAALVISAPYRASGTAAEAVLTLEPARASWRGATAASPVLAGLATELTVTKQRGRAPGRTAALAWRAASFQALPESAAPAIPRRGERQAPPPLPLAAAGGH